MHAFDAKETNYLLINLPKVLISRKFSIFKFLNFNFKVCLYQGDDYKTVIIFENNGKRKIPLR